MVTFDQIAHNESIKTYIRKADDALRVLGYTEHSFAHVTKVARKAREILLTLGYPERTAELAQIAGYLHDIGNVINRADHAQSGAVMAFRILDKLGADAEAAALILADKTDVRRSRVRNRDMATFDIHDRVNYAVEEASTEISPDKSMITLRIRIDTASAAVMDYFEIFLQRMLLCRKAAERLGLRFGLVINDQVGL